MTLEAMILHLKSICNLQHFELSNCTFEQNGFVILADTLSGISTIKSLKIHSNIFTNDDANALVSLIAILSNANLQLLDFSKNYLESHITRIIESLSKNLALTQVTIHNSNNASQSVIDVYFNNAIMTLGLLNTTTKISIIQFFCKFTSLQVLNVRNNQLNAEACKALASVVLHNTGLEELHLSNNNLDKGAIEIMRALQHITSLRLLDLGNSNLPNEVSGELALAVQSNRRLEKLWLYDNDLKSSMIAILQSLSTISTLKILNVSNNKLPEEAGEALASVILHNTGLEELHLCGNDGTLEIMKALQHITSIRLVDLSNSTIEKVPKDTSGKVCVGIKSRNHLEIWLFYDNLSDTTIAVLNSLKTIASLVVLHLNNIHLPPDTCKVLVSVIFSNIGLEELHLSGSCSGEGLLEVVQALQHITSLRSLDLSKNNMPNEVCNKLALAIRLNKHLERLDLHNNNLNSSAMVILNSINTLETLTMLDLSNNQINEEAGESLASIIMHNTELEDLYLIGNNLGEGILEVAKALQHITSLTSLGLNISKEASAELALAIESNKYLEVLWMPNYLHSLKSLILKSLKATTTLTLLDLSNNQFTKEAGEVLAFIVSHNKGLQELCLNNSNLGEEMLEVAKALQYIKSLTSMDLSNNHISKEVFDELALAIKTNKHLQNLWLHNSNLKSSALTILQSLSTISTLKLLSISNNQIPEEADEALASVIMNNTGLEELYLCGNDLSEGFLIVAKALQHATLLRKLNLGNLYISKQASGELALAIKSNKQLKKLWLHNSNLKCSAIVILHPLSTISTLKYLNINDNNITEEAGEALASVILHNTSLKQLHLSGNSLGEGMLIVAKALQHISSLKSLDLGYNNISKEVSDELALAIAANEQLEEVRLYNNNLDSSAIVIFHALSTISALKLINMENNQITKEAGEALASVVLHNMGLQELYLASNNLGEGLLDVARALQHITSLKMLSLSNNNISNEVSRELALAIKSNKHLEKLWFHNCSLKSSVIVILQSLSTISTLKYLNISGNNITEEAGEALASVILHNEGLEELHLSINSLDEGMLIVAKALQHISSLKSLDLGYSNISKEVSDELALAIAANEQLEEVRLYNNNLDSSAIVIFHALSTISALKLINMENNQITKEAGEALASVVLHNMGLQELYLASNNLGEGLLDVARALQHITSLKMLSLSNNNISNEVSRELALAIKSNKHLEKLWFHNCSLKSSVIVILQSLSTISTLKYLNINDNNITEEAGEALASVITNNTGIEALYLSNNKLGDGISEVLKALQHITSLKSLNLSNNNLSKESCGHLAIAIKSNKHLEKLWLQNNKLYFSAIIILQALSNISTLKILHIDVGLIGEAGGIILASVIKNNPGLKEMGCKKAIRMSAMVI